MHRHMKWLLVTLLLVGGLAACQSATPEATTASNPPTATWTAVPTSTPVPSTATTVPTPTPAEPAEKTPTREPVTEAEPTPTRPWQIPGLRDGEHGKGNPDAGLVLVEYSDFQ